MILPKPIKRGGTVGIVALSGPLDAEVVFKGEAQLQKLGYNVVIAPSCFESRGYLAGSSDRARAQDLMIMFSDDEIDAILCMRGGYGCNRIVPYLKKFDFSKYPKPFIGYSDITYMHLYLNQKHQLMTFHGPMIRDLLTENEATTQTFLNCVSGDYAYEMLEIPYYQTDLEAACGQVVGGNLSIICSTLGTPYEIDTKGKVLFIEEINEPVYVIDRLITQLKYSGKIDDAVGIMMGDFNVYDKVATHKLLKKMFRGYKKPIAYDIPSGHCMPNYTIPLGATAQLNPSAQSICFY